MDAEYERFHCEGVPEEKKYIGSDGKEHGMPDIVIHERQGRRNLVAIEIKRIKNKQSRARFRSAPGIQGTSVLLRPRRLSGGRRC